MSEPPTESPFDVIEIVAASGEKANIRRQDFPAWAARGFVIGTVYPDSTTPPPADTPANGG